MSKILHVAATLFITIFLMAPCSSHAGKMKIEKINYSSSWKNYIVSRDAILEPSKQYPYEICFRKAAKKHDLPLTLLLAVARGESDFNPRAQSAQSCYGIMQIQWPGTAKDLGFSSLNQLYDPCRNIEAGARYVKKMLTRYNGDIHLALAAYNYGPGRIPKQAKPWSIPEGANWYSGYIFHHLQQVLSGADAGNIVAAINPKKTYKPDDKIPVILFHNPIRARSFLEYFKNSAPDIPLDWFRTSLGETYIVLLAETSANNSRAIARIEKLGYSVDIHGKFH